MILYTGTDKPKQTVQTQIILVLKLVWSGSTLFAIPSAPFGHSISQIPGELCCLLAALVFRECKATRFMWTVYLADDLQEM